MNLKSISDIILNNEPKFGRSPEAMKIGINWKDIVGPDISKRTSPSIIKSGKLYISVFSSAWVHHLNMLRHDIMSNIEIKTGIRVKGIKCIYSKPKNNDKLYISSYNSNYDKDLEELQSQMSQLKKQPDRIKRLTFLSKIRKQQFDNVSRETYGGKIGRGKE